MSFLAHVALLSTLSQAWTGAVVAQASERGLSLATDEALDGYTLFWPLRSVHVYLCDMQGEVVHEWETDRPPGQSAYLLDEGRLLRCGREANDVFGGGGEGGRVQIYGWFGGMLWDYDMSDERHRQHHDIEPMPNGNVLAIAWEYRSAEQALAAGRDPEQVGAEGFWPDYVAEIEPAGRDGGKVVWEWHAWDHLIQDFDPELANYGDVVAHPERIDVNADHRSEPPLSVAERERLAQLEEEMRALGYMGTDDDEIEDGDAGPPRRMRGGDWLHTNGISYHAELDLIAISIRTLSEVWVIDHSTTTAEARGRAGGRYGHGGDLLYRWGNPKNYGRGTADDQRLYGQHDPTWVAGLEPGTHALLCFNNGGGRGFSSVDEIALPFDAERGFVLEKGQPFGPAQPTWSYTSDPPTDFMAEFISGAQRLSNGNTLVCDGPAGRLFEVTRDRRIVWDFLQPFAGTEPLIGSRRGESGGPGGPPGEHGGPDGAGAPRPAPAGTAVSDGPPARDGEDPGRVPYGLFRGTRLAPDHPGLERLPD